MLGLEGLTAKGKWLVFLSTVCPFSPILSLFRWHVYIYFFSSTATRNAVAEDALAPQSLDLDALSGVPTLVEKINIDGVGRTKDAVLQKECRRIFQSENFEELVLNVDYTIKEFQRMGLFNAVGALIDVGSDANNYQVSFFVKEPNRLIGSLQTTVSGSGDTGLNVALETPNTLGAGQRFRVEQGRLTPLSRFSAE